MLDALKDLYIYHPFLPVENPPEWFSHIKDIHCTVIVDAKNYFSQYQINGNFVRVWLVSIGSYEATLRVELSQLLRDKTRNYEIQEDPENPVFPYVEVPVRIKRIGEYPKPTEISELTPWPNNYMLVDEDFAVPELEQEYELNPDILVIMQKAPKLYVEGILQQVDMDFINGHNVSVSSTNTGVLFYGAAGAGKGVFTVNKLHEFADAGIITYPLKANQECVGLRNINGLYGSVLINGTYPVTITVTHESNGTYNLILDMVRDDETPTA